MIASWAAYLLLLGADRTIVIQAPIGTQRVRFVVPPGFEAVSKERSRLFLQSDQVGITVTWTGNAVDGPMRKAMDQSISASRSKGDVLGAVALGPFSGSILNIPISPSGDYAPISVHAALVAGKDLVSLTYYDSTGHGNSPSKAAKVFAQFVKSGRWSAK
jgi:hypothetical protein